MQKEVRLFQLWSLFNNAKEKDIDGCGHYLGMQGNKIVKMWSLFSNACEQEN